MLILLLLPAPAQAAILAVGPTATYTTIQSAVNAASDGDTLVIDAGTYTECVDLGGRDLALWGAGREYTLLEGDGSCAAALTAEAGETATIGRMTITNPGARAVSLVDATATFHDVTVSDSGGSAIDGGGAAVVGGDVSFEDTYFVGNTGANGGGLYVADGATVALKDSSVLQGVAGSGGGIYVSDETALPCTLILATTRVVENVATDEGAGIYLGEQTSFASQDSLFSSNGSKTVEGTGIYAAAYATLSSTRDAFETNRGARSAVGNGGAIYLASNNTLAATGTTFSSNNGALGGAIFATDGADLSLTDTTFVGNTSAEAGGALYLSGESSVVMTGGSLSTNTSMRHGGAIALSTDVSATLTDLVFEDNTDAFGGGALSAEDDVVLTLDDVTFTDNTSGGSGGAVYLSNLPVETTLSNVTMTGNQSLYGGGGLNTGTSSDVRIEESTFSDNSAEEGGGGAVSAGYFSDLFVARSTFSANQTRSEGGAIFFEYNDDFGTNTLHVEDSTFSDNYAQDGWGGALYSGYAGLTEITGSTFVRNEADPVHGSGGGGAISLYGPSSVTMTKNRFCDNKAYLGGAVMDYGYTADLGADLWEDNAFVENVAVRRGGGMYIASAANASVVNNDFLGNASEGRGGAVDAVTLSLAFINNVVAWTREGNGLTTSDRADEAVTGTFTYNDWYENRPRNGRDLSALVATGTGNISAAPHFAVYTLDGDCDDDLRLASGSPLIDAGDPAILDRDGSRSDIGARPRSPISRRTRR